MDDKNRIDDIISILDIFAQSETTRMKLKISEDLEKGAIQKVYHHGRCDIGSPWATGQAFDVLEDNDKEFCHSIHGDLIKHLIELEWTAFDKARNVGGRAACQDDWVTFQLMRKSQYVTWTVEMLKSFIQDFELANACGRNLIAEKYGWMMESTSPKEFEEIKELLPIVNPDKRKIVDEIVAIQIAWMEELREKKPDIVMNMRSIYASEDTPYNTSYETYLRGELMTYSDETLMLYGRFVANIASRGDNLAEMIVAETLHAQ